MRLSEEKEGFPSLVMGTRRGGIRKVTRREEKAREQGREASLDSSEQDDGGPQREISQAGCSQSPKGLKCLAKKFELKLCK